MKVFVDTNILIDLIFERESFVNDAQKLFAMCHCGKYEIVLSSLSFVNAMYLAKKYKRDIDNVAQSLYLISQFVSISDLEGDNVISSLYSEWKDYEDATQYYCAKKYSCEYIVARNCKDFVKSTIPVLNCNDFFNVLRQEIG